MATSIEGRGRIWSQQHEGWTSYSIGIGSKTQEGTWNNAYQPVRFRKGESVPNGTDIIYKAFPTVVKGKERNIVVWQITEYSIVGEDVQTQAEYSQLTKEDIPF